MVEDNDANDDDDGGCVTYDDWTSSLGGTREE